MSRYMAAFPDVMELANRYSSLTKYYRKIILSAGMVQFTLGLSFVISWSFVSSLFFNIELAVGVIFLLSGIIGIICGGCENRYLISVALIISLFAAVSCVVLVIAIIYMLALMEIKVFTNPWVGSFIVYAAFGLTFSIILVYYAILALHTMTKVAKLAKKTPKENSFDTFSSKGNGNGIPNKHCELSVVETPRSSF